MRDARMVTGDGEANQAVLVSGSHARLFRMKVLYLSNGVLVMQYLYFVSSAEISSHFAPCPLSHCRAVPFAIASDKMSETSRLSVLKIENGKVSGLKKFSDLSPVPLDCLPPSLPTVDPFLQAKETLMELM